jgi:hypothetical protein
MRIDGIEEHESNLEKVSHLSSSELGSVNFFYHEMVGPNQERHQTQQVLAKLAADICQV